jgi:hypothetical protein
MTTAERTGVDIPIKAEHIRAALATARQNQETFGQDEMEWLEAHFPFLKSRIDFAFGAHIPEFGIVKAEAVWSGMLLGSHAVRKCLDDEIEPAKRNLLRHFGKVSITSTDQLDLYSRNWDNAETLGRIFDDEDIVASLMEIRHPSSRNAAAVQIVCLCFAEMPGAIERPAN